MDETNRTKEAARVGVALLCAAALACGGGSHNPQVSGAGLADLPDSVSSDVTEGGPNPPDQTFNVRNTGDCDMAFTMTLQGAGTWLKNPSPASGTVTANGGTKPVTFGFEVVTPHLSPGTYTATIEVAATCTTTGAPAVGSPKAVAVNLNVKALTSVLGVTGADGGTLTGIGVDIPPLQNEWLNLGSAGAPAMPPTTFPFVGWTGTQLVASSGPLLGGGALDPYGDVWTSLPQPSFSNGEHPVDAVAGGYWIKISALHVEQLNPSGLGLWTGGPDVPAPLAGKTLLAATAGARALVMTVGDPQFFAYYDPNGGQGGGTWSVPVDTNSGGATACGITATPYAELYAAGRWALLTVEPDIGIAANEKYCLCDLTTAVCRKTTPPAPLDGGFASSVVWTGGQFVVFVDVPGSVGGFYDPYRDQWTLMPVDHAPPDGAYGAVWTGDRAIAYDGLNGGVLVLSPSPAWLAAPLATGNAPDPRREPSVIWTGAEMLVWGGLGRNAPTPAPSANVFLYH